LKEKGNKGRVGEEEVFQEGNSGAKWWAKVSILCNMG
jgi:hypothetical protein